MDGQTFVIKGILESILMITLSKYNFSCVHPGTVHDFVLKVTDDINTCACVWYTCTSKMS